MRIMLLIQQKVSPELVYYRAEKEEKMRLIIGERLQNVQVKTKLLSAVKDGSQGLRKLEALNYEQLASMFKKAGMDYNKETIQCCFIFLLKKSDDLLLIKTKELIEFVHSSGAKAHEFTMTGASFPIETEL